MNQKLLSHSVIIGTCRVCGSLFATHNKKADLCGESCCLVTKRHVEHRMNPLTHEQMASRYFERYFSYVNLGGHDHYLPKQKPKPKKSSSEQLKPRLRDKLSYQDLKAQSQAERKSNKPPTPPPGWYFDLYEDCYLKEARAMLAGKNCEGKNKCVKLLGDS